MCRPMSLYRSLLRLPTFKSTLGCSGDGYGAATCTDGNPLNTFKEFRFVMSENNTAPSSVTNPTVGVDGL